MHAVISFYSQYLTTFFYTQTAVTVYLLEKKLLKNAKIVYTCKLLQFMYDTIFVLTHS